MPGIEFHLLRPWWLLALPVALAAVWWLLRGHRRGGGWTRVIDPALQPYVLEGGRDGADRQARWPVWLAVVLGCLALAGPSWEQAPQTTWRSEAPLVLVLDLSRSMDATDVRPSRLERAVLKLRDVLAREPAGKIGLIVYTANAFTITPLTSDAATIEALLGALETGIMPSQGSHPQLGLDRGADLMRQAGLRDGDLLLVTDSAGGIPARESVERLQRDGYRTSVLAVGTSEGSPIPETDGGFLRDGRGQVVVTRLREGPLQRLAAAGGGRYARLSVDDADLDHLLAPIALRARQADARSTDVTAERWLDRGAWLTLALLPLALLLFRHRAAVSVLAGTVVLTTLMAVPGPAHAESAGWRALLLPADRRALAALEADDPARAAALFRDREWRAAALYRAGEYDASAHTLEGLDAPRAHYNRGNALARTGDLRAAAEAYRQALGAAPDMADARHNLALVEAAQRERQAQAQQDAPAADPRAAPGADAPAGAEDADAGPAADGMAESGPPGPPDPGFDEGADIGADSPAAADVARDEDVTPTDSEASGDPLQAMTDPAGADDEAAALDEALDQWLRRVQSDPAMLLRRKFEYQYRREQRDQDGNPTWPGDEREPW